VDERKNINHKTFGLKQREKRIATKEEELNKRLAKLTTEEDNKWYTRNRIIEVMSREINKGFIKTNPLSKKVVPVVSLYDITENDKVFDCPWKFNSDKDDRESHMKHTKVIDLKEDTESNMALH